MMSLSFDRARLSNWLVLMFGLVLVVSGSLSVFFQAPIQSAGELGQYRSLIKSDVIQSINSFVLKNKMGTFSFRKAQEDPDNQWHMSAPRKLPASPSVMKQFFTQLTNAKVRKILQQDAINLSNYAFDSPSVVLDLKLDDENTLTLERGLLNPEDNTTFVTLSDQEAIYQVDNFRLALDKIDIGQFIDQRIFTPNLDLIKIIKIYKGGQVTKKPVLALFSAEGTWKDIKERNLNDDKVKAYIDLIKTIRPHFILDQKSEKLQKRLDRYRNNPQYTMVMTDTSGRELTYQVSTLINKLPELKVEKLQTFLISASNREHEYLVSREFFQIFGKKQKAFQPIPFKKLFY